MTHLILIRHSISQPQPGVSAHQWTLTPDGKARCALLAHHLRHYQITHLATSDEPKAYSTARLLADHLNIAVPLIVDQGFRETCRDTAPYFSSEGEFQAAVRQAMSTPDQVIFGEEAFDDARRRFTAALVRLVNSYRNETLAVITHGTVMSLLLGHISEKSTFEIWRGLGMPAFAVLTPTLDLLDLQSSIL